MLTLTQRILIIATSIAIPLVVALLFFIKLDGYDFSFLPPFYAGINALTAVTLVSAVVAIKNKKRERHELLMKVSIGLSLVFLLCYVLYHVTSPTTYFGDTDHNGVVSEEEKAAAGISRLIYFIILASHILLSIGIIPMVLVSYVQAIAGRFDKHRKIAKITFPIWLYIALSGVVVYFMISPFYAH